MALTDAQAESLPVSERYQRIRYLREIEAAEWLADLRRKSPTVQPVSENAKRMPYYGNRRTKVVYERD